MSKTDFSDKLTFHKDSQIMEVDFSGMVFERSRTVNEVYDVIDRQLAKTGQKWFFLVNYLDTRIMAEAWIAFAHRGKLVNIAYSLGSVRFAASGETSDTIMEKSKKEHFDPNLFDSREAAVEHLKGLKDKIPADEWQDTVTKQPDEPGKSLDERIVFHDDLDILEVDFSHYTFATSDDVRAFYGAIDERLEASGKSWYLMVNYQGTEILPDAWFQWSVSSRHLNGNHSLGTVRFNPDDKLAGVLRKRAEANETRANVALSRDDALLRILEMKKSA